MFALKAICLIPGNPARGLDAHQGIVTLFDGETGVPTAILDASAVTEIRTAAVTAVATRELARKDARALAILGAGVQARSHLKALLKVRPFDHVRIYAPTEEHAQAVVDEAPETDAELSVAPSAELAVSGADVVVVATSSREPVMSREWLSIGAHVNAVGASTPTAREIDVQTVAGSALFCDSRESLRNEAGEFLLAITEGAIPGEEHVRAELGEVLAGLKPGRSDDTRADAVSLAGPRRRGSRRRRARRRGRSQPRDRDRGRPVIELAEIESARDRISGAAVRTPLVRLHHEQIPDGTEIYLKLELLQPINSFKIRGATNAILQAPESERAKGLVTASAGNMAQGVAWAARELGLPATIAVPEHAPEAKLAAIDRLGGRVLKLPYEDWWNVIVTSRVDGVDGLFVHPVQDEGVMAGNGTIGLEILEDLPDPDAVVIPYGGGGLTVGIASAIKATRPADKDLRGRARDRRSARGRAGGRRAGRRRLRALVRRRLGQPSRARLDVAARATAGRRRVCGPDRRRRRGGPHAGRADPCARRGGGCARSRRRAVGQGGDRQDRLHRVRWEHQPGETRRDPHGG